MLSLDLYVSTRLLHESAHSAVLKSLSLGVEQRCQQDRPCSSTRSLCLMICAHDAGSWRISASCSAQKCMELRTIARALPRLRRLDLSEVCNHIDDEVLLSIAAGCRELLSLDISGAGGYMPCPTDRAIAAICSSCLQLERLAPPTEEVSQLGECLPLSGRESTWAYDWRRAQCCPTRDASR